MKEENPNITVTFVPRIPATPNIPNFIAEEKIDSDKRQNFFR